MARRLRQSGSWWLAALLVVSAPSAGLGQPIGGRDDPGAAIFLLESLVLDDDGGYRGVAYGTAFFIADDGTALTASHVVAFAQQDPKHNKLMAIVGQEFYSVDLVCASTLGYDATKPQPAGGVSMGRDVAEIKVVPSAFPFLSWGYRQSTGQAVTVASAHRYALPEFPFLSMAARPVVGDRVRVIGYGGFAPNGERWTDTGTVKRISRAPDGTEVFDIGFTKDTEAGNSGSPVLNDDNQFVGLLPWHLADQPTVATAISASALQPVCP